MSEAAEILDNVARLREEALAAIAAAEDLRALEQARAAHLGRKSPLAQVRRSLGSLPQADRPAVGKKLNETWQELERALAQRREELAEKAAAAEKARKAVDVTLPPPRDFPGRLHPIAQTTELLKEVFLGLGFSYDEYPEIETEYHNFEALNTPKWHPARDEQDSFYTSDGRVLRTHTTAFQIRAIERHGPPPLREMTAGRCYRRDPFDPSHSPVFSQLDGIAVEPGVSFADLKWILSTMAKAVFGEKVGIRFRPSYFPFTTPSAEMDVSCQVCGGKGCGACKRTGWVEILGSGMMRPEVLRAAGLDPEKVSGLAFGIGIERIAMQLHRVDDIRMFYWNDIPFLRQF